jgi:hypothetical protein
MSPTAVYIRAATASHTHRVIFGQSDETSGTKDKVMTFGLNYLAAGYVKNRNRISVMFSLSYALFNSLHIFEDSVALLIGLIE